MTRKRCALALGFALISRSLLPWVEPAWATPQAEDVMTNNPLVEQAVADLAQRESVPISSIVLVSFEAVTWPDTSMGCPHPGMRYHQVPQDGARIVLKVKGEQRVYHSGGKRAPFLCTRY